MRRLVILGLLVVCAVSAVNADDYVRRGDYYYYGSSPQAYYRSLITTPGYWSYGHYVPGYSYYQYHAYTPPAAPTPPLPVAPGDWRSKTLDIAKVQAQYAAKYQAELLEQKHYLEAVNFLGLQNLPRYPTYAGYGTVPPYALGLSTDGHYSSTYLSGYGANASTTYGYNSYAAPNQDPAVLLSQLFQMANQHVVNSQALSEKAQTGFQDRVGQVNAGQQKIAELQAKAGMIVSMLKALEGPPSALTQGFSFKVTPAGIQTDASKVDPTTKAALALQFKALVEAKCIACHSGATKKGGFDIASYGSLTADGKQAVWERLVTKDPNRMMPRVPPDNKPGVPLTQEELRLFALN